MSKVRIYRVPVESKKIAVDKYVLFWKTDESFGCFSQWAKSGFIVDGQYYRCAEQYMMAAKAKLFEDDKTLQKIMVATSPMIMKKLGRSVSGYDDDKWGSVRFKAVVKANFAKFSQNDELKKMLLDTGDAIIAEASPKDAIWGIGIKADKASKMEEKDWPGQNLLGKALMEVRKMLKEGKGETQFVAKLKKQLREEEEKLNSERQINAGIAKVRQRPTRKPQQELRDISVPLDRPIEGTNKTFVLEAQRATQPMVISSTDSKGLSGLGFDFTKEQQLTKIEFDRKYRPYVYKVLLAGKEKDGLGFALVNLADPKSKIIRRVPVLGGITGEEVFSEVLMRLFGGSDRRRPAILNFDITKGFVGQGAFRLFLREVVKSVYYDLTRKDLVTMRDRYGHVIYKQDPHTGRYLLDKKGKRIPRKEPRSVVNADKEVVQGFVDHLGTKDRVRKERTVLRRRINLKYLAYLHVIVKTPQNGWFYNVARDIFERGVPADQALSACLEKGLINHRRNFDQALFRLRGAIDEKTRELSQVLFGDADLSEGEALVQAWVRAEKKFGKFRVDEVHTRVLKAIMASYEDWRRE